MVQAEVKEVILCTTALHATVCTFTCMCACVYVRYAHVYLSKRGSADGTEWCVVKTPSQAALAKGMAAGTCHGMEEEPAERKEIGKGQRGGGE